MIKEIKVSQKNIDKDYHINWSTLKKKWEKNENFHVQNLFGPAVISYRFTDIIVDIIFKQTSGNEKQLSG